MYKNNIEYGYSRCSTNEDKQSVDYQIKELLSKGVERENIFVEYESGSNESRIEFNKLLRLLKSGDTLRTTDITRLSRSTKQLCELVDMINQMKIRLIIGSLEVDCRGKEIDPMVEGMLKMMAVFSELERKMKIYQIKLGLSATTKKIGRPIVDKEFLQNDSIFLKYYAQYKNNQINISEMSKLLGKSRGTIYSYINIIEK